MDYQKWILLAMELIGTIAFAVSGAMLGAEKKMDIFGVCVLGVVTSVGGGVIRDLVLGVVPPNVFQKPIYALTATVTSCLVFFLLYLKKEWLEGHFRKIYEKLLLIMDCIGLGVFTVMGVYAGIQQGYIENMFLLVFLGTVTGIGGGIIRDMMAGVPPYVFVRHIYACASIAGAVICVLSYRVFGAVPSMMASFWVIVGIRYLAVKYQWNLPRLK